MDLAALPFLGQCRKKLNDSVIGGTKMALDKHFVDTRRSPKVPVDLEQHGRMDIHQIIGGTVGQKPMQAIQGRLAILQASEEIDHPRLRPAHRVTARAPLSAIGQAAV